MAAQLLHCCCRYHTSGMLLAYFASVAGLGSLIYDLNISNWQMNCEHSSWWLRDETIQTEIAVFIALKWWDLFMFSQCL